ncbi:MAG: hypothetical protein HZA72_02520, partial [Candidatus Omnitrophica bacterium]|nr:hypothetical protein [Candidatus Omnitrophota bacterium]
MIEYQINPTKHLILKIIAVVLVVAFVWYDISWAGDLFYHNNLSPKQVNNIDNKKVQEVTNYDMLSYDKRKSGAEELLPTGQEKEQSQKFSPWYIQEQQTKHEEIIKQKQDTEDILWALDQNLKRKLQKQEDEDWELKKKRGGPERKLQEQGGQIQYTLSDFDENGEAQQINVYNYNSDGSLQSITSYSIKDLDKSRWGGREFDSKDGKKFFGSTEKADMTGLTEDRILEKVFYSGSKGSEKIDYVLSGYSENGKPGTVSIYDYGKDGNPENLDEVRSYNIEGETIDFTKNKSEWSSLLTEDKLTRTTVYEGEKDKERIKYVLDDYSVNSNGRNTPNMISVYDYNNNPGEDPKNESLDEVRSYDISGFYGTDGWGVVLSELLSDDSATLDKYKADLLESVSAFSGAKGAEVITQTYYYDEGEIVSRKDYSYYEYDAKYSEHKKKALRNVYTYDTDSEAMSEAERKARGAGELVEEDVFTGTAGREKISQTFTYDEAGNIVERKDYIYENGVLKSVFTFNTEDVTGDRRSRLSGTLIGESIFTGRAGKEKISQS